MKYTETYCGPMCYVKFDDAIASGASLEERAAAAASWLSSLIANEDIGAKSVHVYTGSKRADVRMVVAGSSVSLQDMKGMDDPALSMMIMIAAPEVLNGEEICVSVSMDDMRPEIILNQEACGKHAKQRFVQEVLED
ncbi:MAG: hypothetical protein SOI44_01830 [Lactimicrobium sp.]|uniref:hypothetical protein n=1 Tax=Lactimicrobium sp. TaxID=2563780 RepID=UPI002F350214